MISSELAVGARNQFEHIDPALYEGGFDGESDDFMVFPRGVRSEELRASVVVRGQIIETDKQNVTCKFKILNDLISVRMATSLIRYCVLHDLPDYSIADAGLTIRFERQE